MSACPYCNVESESLDVHWSAECRHAPGFVKTQADIMVRQFGVAKLVEFASLAAGVPYGPRSEPATGLNPPKKRGDRSHVAARKKRAGQPTPARTEKPRARKRNRTPPSSSGDPFGLNEEEE